MKRAVVGFSLLLILAAAKHGKAAYQWSLDDGGNGHWYEAVYVPERITWLNANDAATASGGYLATILSSAENDFVYNLISDPKFWMYDNPPFIEERSQGPWLGGTDVNGSWEWVTGETWSFTAWAPPEPLGNGDYLQYFTYLNPTAHTWNDTTSDWNGWGLVGAGMYGYVVEYNVQPVPEASSIAVWSVLAVCAIGYGKWRKRRSH